MGNIVSTVIVDYPYMQTLGIMSFQIRCILLRIWLLFLTSITSFTVDTLNSLSNLALLTSLNF